MNVLLVDDSEVGQFFISNLLRRSGGHNVDIAADGAQAWEMLQQKRYDIVLSDILMPNLDGFELCYLVKSTAETRQIPFVFFSAEYLSAQDQAFAHKLGAARYIFMTQDPVAFVKELESTVTTPREDFPPPPEQHALDEHAYLKGYKDRLFQRLHHKVGQLEQATEQWQVERQAARRLRDLDQKKDNFIAILSHELRNPLTTIMGYCDILLGGLQGQLTPDQQQSVAIINDRSDHVLAMIQRLLDFVHLRGTGPTATAETVSLADQIGQVLAAVAPQAAAKALALERQVAPELPAAWADRQLLHQVLIILLDNAIKFTPEGGRITIAADAPADAVRVQVRDTGIGIPEQHMPLIFEPFHRGDPMGHPSQPGVGLGLAIARQFIAEMGGRIEVESVPEQGTCFSVILPRPPVG